MRTRIIFRGLTLFTFDKSSCGASPGGNLGTMTAHLISDPQCAGMPQGEHVAKLGINGRDCSTGALCSGVKQRFATNMRVEQKGLSQPAGVIVDQSFLDYVPDLAALHWDKSSGRLDRRFITRSIEIPSGRVRSGDFIAWYWRGNTPATVGYMDTFFGGFSANEVIVELGDDSDINSDDPDKYLEVTAGHRCDEYWPRVKGHQLDDDIEPNTVELEFTNLTTRRRRPIFWSLHYQAVFDAAGFRRRSYVNTEQFRLLNAAATDYDAYEWDADVKMIGVDPGQPFPFLSDPKKDVLSGIAEADSPYIVQGPPPFIGRQRTEAIPMGKSPTEMPDAGIPMSMAGATGDDPENSQICPNGRM
jgi:hypothetical protein